MKIEIFYGDNEVKHKALVAGGGVNASKLQYDLTITPKPINFTAVDCSAKKWEKLSAGD